MVTCIVDECDFLFRRNLSTLDIALYSICAVYRCCTSGLQASARCNVWRVLPGFIESVMLWVYWCSSSQNIRVSTE
jgi:hypothetical protein